MTPVLARAGPAALAALLLAGAAGPVGAQEPATGDTAARDSAGMASISDPAVAARMDSVRQAERQKRNAAVRSLLPGDRIRVQLGQHVVEGELLNLVDGELVMRTARPLPRGLGEEAEPPADTAPPEDEGPVDPPPADTAAAPAPLPPGGPEDPLASGADTLPPRAVRVPVDAMERLWVEVGSTDRGGAWGAAVGGVLGAVGGYLIDTASCDQQEGDCIFDGFTAGAVTGLGGALAGAGLGALVGKAFPRWRLWFP